MDKHAYLLLIHENSLVLNRLIRLIDDNWNDIYIHIDKNAKNIDPSEIKQFAQKSKVYFVKRHKVYWGTNSIMEAEIELFKAAAKQQYQYYHLLSGADLPIKTQKEIHDFFEENNGKEFIHFGTEQYQKDIQERYNQYHFFTKRLGRKETKNSGYNWRHIHWRYKEDCMLIGRKRMIFRFMAVPIGAALHMNMQSI